MTSPSLCDVCIKGRGTFKCEGCSKILCTKDSMHHRSELSQQLEEIELMRDVLYQKFTEDSQQNSMLKKVDQWEKESITKIHKAAEEVRVKINEDSTDFQENLNELTHQLRQAREEDGFVEVNLEQWRAKLNELEETLRNSRATVIEENSPSFLTKIRIEYENASDIFQDVCGDIQIDEHGYRAVKDNWIGYSEVLGKKEYVTGTHFIRFQIEKVLPNGWILFGIISKSEPLCVNSHSFQSTYGWTTCDQIHTAGKYRQGPRNRIVSNDIIVLVIDCDQMKIRMINERTNHKMELAIDIRKCLFPWKLHFNLLTASTVLRILSSFD